MVTLPTHLSDSGVNRGVGGEMTSEEKYSTLDLETLYHVQIDFVIF
jgi:hypothetical protein